MIKIILIRHGQSEANLTKSFAGQYNSPISELGRKQAEKTAQFVFENFKVYKIYSSDLDRAYNTAKPIGEKFNIPVIADEGLREISAGEWEGLYIKDIMERFPKDFETWVNDIGNSRCTGGESPRELGARIYKHILEIVRENIDAGNDGKTIVIATHAAAIKSFYCMCNGGDFNTMKDIPWISNASVSIVLSDGKSAKFEEFGLDDHLAGMISTVPSRLSTPLKKN